MSDEVLDGEVIEESPRKYIASEVAVEMAMTAVVVHPTLEQASLYLRSQGYQASVRQLRYWRDRKYHDRFVQMRKELSPKIEAEFADDMLTTARLATETERILIARTRAKALKNEIQDPARAARDMAMVRSHGLEKRLMIEGRPRVVHERRDLTELLDRLIEKGILHETPEIPESTGHGRDAEDAA